jgi:excisionase family DNA binding protein
MRGVVELKKEPRGLANQEPPEPTYIDILGAAALVFVSPATIRRALTKGKLTRYKFGSRTLISRNELLSKIRVAS